MNVLPQAHCTLACMYLGWIFSFMGSFSLCRWDDVDFAPVVARGCVLHFARDEREERVVLADADVLAGKKPRAPLANQHRTCLNTRAREFLHAEPLAGGVATVTGRACALFVCHFLSLDLRDPERRLRLAVPASAALPRLVLVTEDVDLRTLAMGDDLRRHFRAAERGLTGLHVVAVRDDEDVAERDGLTDLACVAVDADEGSLFDAVLLAAPADDGVRRRNRATGTEKAAARVRDVDMRVGDGGAAA